MNDLTDFQRIMIDVCIWCVFVVLVGVLYRLF